MAIGIVRIVARLGVLVSSIISLALNAKFLINASWANDLLIYIIVIASLSILACLLPHLSVLYDLFWGIVTALSAVFALVIQVNTLSTSIDSC